MCTDKKSHPKNLRLVTIFTSIISLGLSIPYAIVYGQAAPAIGLIVCGISSFISLISYPWRRTLEKAFRRRSTEYRIVLTADDDDGKLPSETSLNIYILLFMDTLLAGLSLLVFILATMEMDRGWSSRGDILGTYATLPYLVNFGVHGYLAFVELVTISKESWKPVRVSCPHCHKSLSEAPSLSDDDSETRGDRGTRMSGGVPSEVAQV